MKYYSIDFKRIQTISQREKDIVYGYIKKVQSLFSSKENSYYIIAQLIQELCLLFYQSFIDTKILTKNEIDSLLNLLRENNKFVGNQWILIYRKSTDGRYSDEKFVRSKYEDKSNILCIIESVDNNVLGGYTSSGFKTGSHVYNTDDKAYVFGIRSSKEFEPSISNVKPGKRDKAVLSCDGYYFYFGWTGVIFMQNGKVFHQNSKDYEPFPTSLHLLGGSYNQQVKDMEIFQLR